MSVLLSAREISKSFAHKPLFSNLSIDLRAGEKVGLIGPNGAGKSTLLKILAGLEDPDEGERSSRRGVRIGFVAQDDSFPAGQSCLEVVVAALRSDHWDEQEKQTRATIVLTQVGFIDYHQAAETLSGGWRKRLSLARELANQPDFLLMDEPTNHLDLPGVIWLEKLLRNASFGYLAATHDRAFLRAVVDEVIEINRAYPDGVFRVAGGYDEFADKKEAFLEAQEREREAVANRVRRETDWLAHKARARTRKASSRIEAAADRREQLAELNYRTAEAGSAGIDFAATGRQTRKLLWATGLSKQLGDKALFRGIDLHITPGLKLGLLGPNGSGKSTLLKVLLGDIPADSGTIARADRLRVEVFEQGRSSLDLTLSLRRALTPNGDTVMFRDSPMHVAAWASRFMFNADQLDLEISALSGGEQARVRIAQLMLKPADLLLLDEPTNDLDIPALELLEENLEEFAGAVVIVSHDRDLLDRICNQVVGLDGLGGASTYGNVNQWLAAYEKATAPIKEEKAPKASDSAAKAKSKRLSFKEQQEFDGIEAKIVAAEELVATKQVAVERAANASHTVLGEACRELEAAQHEVERLYTRWQELEEKRK
jgi:ATP-binding cassette subfamily F protein uup